MEEFQDVTSGSPGKTYLAEHDMETGSARPAHLPSHHLLQAYRNLRKNEMVQDAIACDYGPIIQ